MNDKDGLIEEYKSLREEIARRQDARLLVLGFTVTGIGTMIGLTLNDGSVVVQGLNYYAFALISFALVMLIVSLLLTIQHTQQIAVISTYIRRFIEPNINGIRWESRWTRYRESRRSNPKAGGLPLGTSKPLALYYGFLTVAVYCVSFVRGMHYYWPALVLVSALAIGSLACSFVLYTRRAKGWRIDWSIVDE